MKTKNHVWWHLKKLYFWIFTIENVTNIQKEHGQRNRTPVPQIQLPGPFLSLGLLKQIPDTMLFHPSITQNSFLKDKDFFKKQKYNTFISLKITYIPPYCQIFNRWLSFLCLSQNLNFSLKRFFCFSQIRSIHCNGLTCLIFFHPFSLFPLEFTEGTGWAVLFPCNLILLIALFSCHLTCSSV